MNKRLFAVLLALSFVWTLGGAGELFAAGPGTSPNKKDLSDMPSGGEVAAMALGAVFVITLLVLAITHSGDDGEAEEADDPAVGGGNGRPPSSLRIDPVLTLDRDTLGAGVAFSF